MVSKGLFWLLQLTWGLPQTILGLIVFLININKRHYVFNYAVATEWDRSSGISLGLFIFVPKESLRSNDKHILFHEYGHTVQSLTLGPAYLLFIGIPSIIWFATFAAKKQKRQVCDMGDPVDKAGCTGNKKTFKKSEYTDFYTEKWAENVGNNRRIKEENNKHLNDKMKMTK